MRTCLALACLVALGCPEVEITTTDLAEARDDLSAAKERV